MANKGELGGGLFGLLIASIPGAWGIGAFGAFQVGAAIGGILFPTEAPNVEEGRLSDVRTSGSSQGVPIPYVFGRERLGTTMIWCSSVREVAIDQGGGKK